MKLVCFRKNVWNFNNSCSQFSHSKGVCTANVNVLQQHRSKNSFFSLLSLLTLLPLSHPSHFKWDKGSLDGQASTKHRFFLRALEQRKRQERVLAVKAIILHLSLELLSYSQMHREIVEERKQTWLTAEQRSLHLYLGLFWVHYFLFYIFSLFPLTFNSRPVSLRSAVCPDRVKVTWLRWNVTCRNLLPELIGQHCSGQGC